MLNLTKTPVFVDIDCNQVSTRTQEQGIILMKKIRVGEIVVQTCRSRNTIFTIVYLTIINNTDLAMPLHKP